MHVEGNSKVKVEFRLRTDDDHNVSGVFASKIKIGKHEDGSVELARSKEDGEYVEEEVITKSGTYEAGKDYIVKRYDSSKDTGHIIKNNGTTV